MAPKKAAKKQAAKKPARVTSTPPSPPLPPTSPPPPPPPVVQSTAADVSDDGLDNVEVKGSFEDLDLHDEAGIVVHSSHPEQVSELDAKLLSYLRTPALTNFLRFKILKRQRDADDGFQPNSKKLRRTEDPEYEDNWHAQALLGSGSFGQVGLWQQRDSSGNVVDELAVKEAKYEVEYVWSKRSGLSTEAVMTNHVNKTEVDNFVQLRGFKCFAGRGKNANGTVPTTSKWIYYLEYAPHGDISRLIDRYRAWDQYLPEAFLWHIFDGLAKAIVSMAELETKPEELPDQTGGQATEIKGSARIIHFDIKPQNIFLGRANGDRDRGGLDTSTYPTPKLADFGVAEFADGRDEHTNPKRLWESGTVYYKPPEQTMYGVMWANPPNYAKQLNPQLETGVFMVQRDIEDAVTEDNKDFCFTQKMNTWNVGKTMYDLMSLSRPRDYARKSTTFQHEYEGNGQNAIANFDVIPFDLERRKSTTPSTTRPQYSTELTDLVQACMKPEVQDRINVGDLFKATQVEIAKWNSKGQNEGFPRVFFQKNEINEMQLGSADFPVYEGVKNGEEEKHCDIDDLLGAKLDPDWEDLRLPQEKWKDYVSGWQNTQSKEKQPSYPVVDGKINFEANVGRSRRPAKETTSAQGQNPVVNRVPAAPAAPAVGPATIAVAKPPVPVAATIGASVAQPQLRNRRTIRPPARLLDAAQSSAAPAKVNAPKAAAGNNKTMAQPGPVKPKAIAKPAQQANKKGKAPAVSQPVDSSSSDEQSAADDSENDDTDDDSEDDDEPSTSAPAQRKQGKAPQKATRAQSRNAKPSTKTTKPPAKVIKKSTKNIQKPAAAKSKNSAVADANVDDEDEADGSTVETDTEGNGDNDQESDDQRDARPRRRIRLRVKAPSPPPPIMKKSKASAKQKKGKK